MQLIPLQLQVKLLRNSTLNIYDGSAFEANWKGEETISGCLMGTKNPKIHHFESVIFRPHAVTVNVS